MKRTSPGNAMRDHLPFIPARVTPQDVNNIQPYFHLSSTRKSKNRLNDQLIPKPTEINIGEKMFKVAFPKEHPYSSHICRFAMFPSLHCPEDTHRGVRAALQPTLNPLVPGCAPQVTVIHKAIGGPYRQEIVQKSERKALVWPGQHGFWEMQHAKPLQGMGQVFYPTPPKTMVPNPKLREWHMSFSERTANMLKNLEKSYWLTSYQMDYTGSGPANPIKLDDFTEKLITTGRMTSHTAPLKERSYPEFVPPKPRHGRRARRIEGHHPPTEIQLSASPPPTAYTQIQDGSATSTQQYGPYEITAKDNGIPRSVLNHSGTESSKDITETGPTEMSKAVSHSQGLDGRMLKSQLSHRPYYQGEIRPGERENRTVRFEEGQSQALTETNAKETAEAELTDIGVTQEEVQFGQVTSPALAIQPASVESEAEVASTTVNENQQPAMEPLFSCPSLLPRPPVFPCSDPLGTAVGRGNFSSLLELQDSFSKWKAHENFASSITPGTVDLRDNKHTEKKHNFYGVNCYYLHG